MSEIALRATWHDYLEMCKPRVVVLMLLCAVVGMFLATPRAVPLDLVLYASLGIALVAGSAAVVNHVADQHIDAKMARTESRPVATGRVTNSQAMIFSAITGVLGIALLWFLVNPLTAWLNLASWVGYGLIYTLYLKRATSQNIVIGGLFGAAPPLFGWTAVTNSIDPGGLLLVLIIFAWTPPHFWALALERKDEYADVGMPMLPVTHGEAFTRLHILLYTILLVVASVLPFVIAMSGPLYLAGALALGAGFLYWAIVLIRNNNDKAPMETFRYSILYLGALFLVMLVDHYLFLGVSSTAPIEMIPLSA
ncbi:MAG: heme o synthase [Pseudomonadota bacterium]|jgi:protoheme IX farnesyltransferase|nr:heme o synthase [Pseudomonadales bacterium]MEC7107207.1 heme o synthase [Pseudomonadota bacterium]MEC8618132.1 heme o synthase [Pseudomonadota bacterium]MEC8620919.1 heme o synthase [Pseudomonadota bacterium]MEC9155577.1 heme o synthase [Pseudomonadota bacterium]